MSKVIRSFFAVDIPDLAKAAIDKACAPLKELIHGVKWVEVHNLHITLKFLGNAEHHQLDFLKEKLYAVLSGERPFQIKFSRISVFPTIEEPKVIWLGLERGEEPLKNLAFKIEETSIEAGFQPESKLFSAHLTLGRVKDGQRFKNLNGLLASFRCSQDGPILIDHVELYQSILTGHGPQYRRLQRFGLK